MSDLVDELLARPGLYLGTQEDPTGEHGSGVSVSRLELEPLPAHTGVLLRYEVLSPKGGLVHDERALLARSSGGLMLVTAHAHAEVVTVMPETEPGYFVAGDLEPYPMAIRLVVPEPGHLIYSWSYGRPGDVLAVRDIGDLRHVPD